MRISSISKFIIVIIIATSALCVCPFIGTEFISPFEMTANSLQSKIFISLRVPRVITAFLAGGGLSLCGMVFQAMFRNPLAEPFTLGIASGASCGAALTIFFKFSNIVPHITFTSIGAFLGASLAGILVYGFSKIPKKADSLTILLAGVAVSFIFNSLLMFLQYLIDLHDSFRIIRWLMGGLEIFGYQSLGIMAIFILTGTLIISWKLPEIDHLLTGEDIAQSRGVNVVKTNNLLLFASILIVSSIVANCGPIGFVGLIIPHISRRFFSVNHKIIGPVSFLLGGSFLLVGDTIAKTVIAPIEIPVGVITSLLGAPFFLWILLRWKKNNQKGFF
jgi:iron complex transport system permease protein